MLEHLLVINAGGSIIIDIDDGWGLECFLFAFFFPAAFSLVSMELSYMERTLASWDPVM